MIKVIKKINKDIVFIFSAITFSIIILIIYNFKVEKDKKFVPPGFQAASSVKNNKSICNGDASKSKNVECLISISREFKKNQRNILFLGNSQTGAINNFKKNDEDYISIINKNKNLQNRSLQIKSIWLPNGNLREFNKIINQLDICKLDIDLVVLPIFLDDMRENIIREEIKMYSSKICKNDNPDKKVEDKKRGKLYYLNEKIKNNFMILGKIEKLNQSLKISFYKLRNFAFNIKPDSARIIKESSYQSNLKALKELIEKRRNKKLKTLIYIPPLLNSNGDGKIPYLINEYNNFKSDISNLCNREYCIFFNFEKTIPSKYWGTKNSTSLSRKSEIDFMHFSGEGHKIFAKRFVNLLINLEIVN